ncbi:conjugal transfer protein [Natribacillus halophilus]|uniref:TcpE family protein n=1 Tax=Natribacillus halophilus TaxID=549003 RepID=A0A1G8PYN4_9BACI|nr:conjugal transfer protein [Natribacillus halophilus]SDI97581.1 TcpE family protein [Natribacillus halophilus]
MRVIFNYRQALREPKKIQQITENYSLPFSIEFIPAMNFLIFMAMTAGVLYGIHTVFPFALEWTFVIFLIGIPLMLTALVKKIQPDGKNIYLYIYDFVKYLVSVKLPNKRLCHDRPVAWMKDARIQFRQCVKVGRKKHGRIKNTDQNDDGEFIVNEYGRRVGVLSYSKHIDSQAE